VKEYPGDQHAVSHTQAVILLIAITILLALLVLLMLRFPEFSWNAPSEPPEIIIITSVYHVSDRPPNAMNYDSRVILRHNGTERLENDALAAAFYRNEEPVNCRIETLNGHLFISTRHYGVEVMWGSGCSGTYWNPGEKTGIDFTDGTFRPGDRVRVDVIEKSTGNVVSRHTFTA